MSAGIRCAAAAVLVVSAAAAAAAGDREYSSVMAWGNLHVFQRGDNGLLQFRTWSPDVMTWSKWEDFAGVLITSTPSALMTSETRLAVFFRGVDGKLYHLFQDKGGPWSGVIGLGSRQLVAGPNAVIVSGQLTVLARGSEGKLMQIYYDQARQSWTDWSNVD